MIETDLARDDGWQDAVADADVVVLSHAQIGGLDEAAFTANNVTATERVIAAVRAKAPYVVHLSSSVVESAADDWYVQSKDAQEKLVVGSGLPVVVLRPTLMFGWFDRKHLGWLARFMQKAPLFPIPGSGRYLRQPLYAGDFCDIIMACIEQRPTGKAYNISGPGEDRLHRPDPRREGGLRRARADRAHSLFGCSGRCSGSTRLFDRDPPFTTKQLEALVTPDVFEVIDWPGIFGVKATPLKAALAETYPPSDLFADRAGVLMSRVVVIGAGAMGLAAAYHALKRGHQVTVLEAAPEAGRHGGAFRSRRAVDRALLPFRLQGGPADLRAAGRARHRRQDALGADLDGLLRRRQALSLGRSGLAADVSEALADREAALRRDDVLLDQAQRLASLENVSAKDWITRWCGRAVYERLWAPLFRLKFFEYADNISAAWIWTRIKRVGTSRTLADAGRARLYRGRLARRWSSALTRAIEAKGGALRLGAPVDARRDAKVAA